MAANKQASVPITIRLSEETLEIISREFKSTPVADALSSRCSQFVDAMAHGGFMLGPDHVTAIETNYKQAVGGPKDIIKATEAAASREDGRNSYKFTIDPAFEAPLQERANEIGRTPGELMGELVDYALDQQWVYSLQYEGMRRTFSREQDAALADLIGKPDFTVSDIITALRARGKRSKEDKLESVEA